MLIGIDKLRASLGGVPILHDVCLSLGEGEIYGLLGPNGAGKSTAIAVALGLLKSDARHLSGSSAGTLAWPRTRAMIS